MGKKKGIFLSPPWDRSREAAVSLARKIFEFGAFKGLLVYSGALKKHVVARSIKHFL